MVAVLVAGCSGTGLVYPSTSSVGTDLRKPLTPAEQKAVIEDLQGAGETPAAVSVPILSGLTTSGG